MARTVSKYCLISLPHIIDALSFISLPSHMRVLHQHSKEFITVNDFSYKRTRLQGVGGDDLGCSLENGKNVVVYGI